MGQKHKLLQITTASFVLLSSCLFMATPSYAATQNDTIGASLDIGGTLALSCSSPITMSAVTGTGRSTPVTSNASTCNVKTTNSGGYKLEWQAGNSSDSGAMKNANGDLIAQYTAAAPEQWSVAATDSEWGARLGRASTTYNTTTWGAAATDDDYTRTDVKWFKVDHSTTYQIISRADQTGVDGDDEIIIFGSEIGSNKFQPTGTYSNTVTMTATTL